MDGGAWWAAVHGIPKSQTRLSDFTFTSPFHALEKAMATHSSVLAWRIPGTGEPGGLPSMGSHRVGHDWSDFAAAATGIWEETEMLPSCPSQENTVALQTGARGETVLCSFLHPPDLCFASRWTEKRQEDSELWFKHCRLSCSYHILVSF